MESPTLDMERLSIYKAARIIKRRDNSLYNALRSICEDSIFVGEISQLWPELPLLANLRCGLWYSREFHSTCYFKSTDGHTNNWSFNTSRLNLHVGLLAETEKALIQDRLEGWTMDLEASGADIASLALSLRKPLRPLWISQKTIIWLNEVPEYDSWDFTPIILVSASSSCGNYQQQTTSEFSWNYIPGAADDEESWARGLSPYLFWKHAYDLISSGPDLCNQKVAEIVEKDRVYHAQRGLDASQMSIETSRFLGSTDHYLDKEPLNLEIPCVDGDDKSLGSSRCNDCAIFWIDSTNVAVGSTCLAMELSSVDSMLNCDREPLPHFQEKSEDYLHLPIMSSKFDRFSLLRSLPNALDFAKMKLREGKRLIICCKDGEDISICVCLAILISLFDDRGHFDEGQSFTNTCISKSELRRRLVYICKFAVNARPSRGNLKQVFNYLNGENVSNP